MKRWLWLLLLTGCAAPRTLPTPVAVKQGPFQADMPLVAVVQPLDSQSVGLTQGLSNSSVEMLVPEGTQVKRGDVIARVNSRHVLEALIDRKESLATEQANLANLRANAPVNLGDVAHDIVEKERGYREKTLAESKVAQGGTPDLVAAAHRDVQLGDLALADDQLAAKESLYEKGAIGRQELEDARRDHDVAVLDRKSALLALSQLRPGAKQEDLEQARLQSHMAKSAYTRAQLEAPAKRAVLALDTARSEVNLSVLTRGARELAKKVKAVNVYAPANGMVLYPLIWGWKKVHVGLQVWPGLTFLTVARLDRLELDGAVSEAEIADVRVGERAEITFDGFPGRVFPAHVTHVSKLAKEEENRNGSNNTTVKRFDVKLRPDQPTPELKPNMRVAVRLITGELQAASAVPREALFGDAAHPFIWLADARLGPRKQSVTPKLQGTDWVALAESLPAGAQVYLLDPTQPLASSPAPDATGGGP